MRMVLGSWKYAVLVAVAAGLPSAHAQEALYGGVGIGQTKTYYHQDSLGITGATASSLTRNDGGAGGKIFAGYRANPNVAVEVGYVDLGKSGATRNMSAPTAGSIAQDTRNTGWFLDVVGMMPIGVTEFALIGKIGGVATETGKQLSTGGTVSPSPGSPSTFNERELNWKFGAGAQYDFNKTVSARGEWERYRRIGKMTGAGENEADLFSLNLLIKFK